MRLLLAEDGYEIRKIDESKYPKSKRRQWTYVMKTILNNFPFSNKQRRLLEALTSSGSLEINEIADATGSKARVHNLIDFLGTGQYRVALSDAEFFVQTYSIYDHKAVLLLSMPAIILEHRPRGMREETTTIKILTLIR